MAKPLRIAIVEDNDVLAAGMARAFRADGHGVDLLSRGRAACNFLLQEDVDLVILDINLPDISGFDVLSKLRAEKDDTPVLMLTARSELADKISGLDAGADDYLTKPFEIDELKARVRALLRRRNRDQVSIISLGSLEYDPNARGARIDGVPVDLPRKESALLELIISRPSQVVSKLQIIDHIYGSGADVEESTVELYVHRLRKRLSGCGVKIKTLRGLGYCLQETK